MSEEETDESTPRQLDRRALLAMAAAGTAATGAVWVTPSVLSGSVAFAASSTDGSKSSSGSNGQPSHSHAATTTTTTTPATTTTVGSSTSGPPSHSSAATTTTLGSAIDYIIPG